MNPRALVAMLPAVLVPVALVALSAIAGRRVASSLWEHPELVKWIVCVLGSAAGLSVIFGMGTVREEMSFRRNGYRERCSQPDRFLYEEVGLDGSSRFLPLGRKEIGDK